MTDADPTIPAHRLNLLKGFSAAAVVVMIWSGFNIVSRLGGRSPLTPYDMVAIRFVVSGMAFLPFMLTRWNRLKWPRLAVLAAIGGTGYTLFIYSGYALAPAAHAGILVNGGIPFASALITWLILGHRPGIRTEFALLVAGLGIVLFGFHSLGQISGAPAHQWVGDMFCLLAAISFASFVLLLKHWHVPPIEATVGVSVISWFSTRRFISCSCPRPSPLFPCPSFCCKACIKASWLPRLPAYSSPTPSTISDRKRQRSCWPWFPASRRWPPCHC